MVVKWDRVGLGCDGLARGRGILRLSFQALGEDVGMVGEDDEPFLSLFGGRRSRHGGSRPWGGVAEGGRSW